MRIPRNRTTSNESNWLTRNRAGIAFRVSCVPFITSSSSFGIGASRRTNSGIVFDTHTQTHVCVTVTWRCHTHTHIFAEDVWVKMSSAFRPTFHETVACVCARVYYDQNNMCTFVYICDTCMYTHLVYLPFRGNNNNSLLSRASPPSAFRSLMWLCTSCTNTHPHICSPLAHIVSFSV